MTVSGDVAARRVFEEAARLLGRDGWRQHVMGPSLPDAREPRCPVGALAAACHAVNDEATDIDALAGELCDTLNIRVDGEWAISAVAGWNDDAARTRADVRAAFAATIIRLGGRDGG